MPADGHDTDIARIDDDTRAELVRNALQDRHAQLVSWRPQPVAGGASGSELYAVAGTARSNGAVVPWRFVVKILNRDGLAWQEGSTDPSAWNYWMREWLVYRSRWIRELDGLVAPQCFGSGQIGETAAWLAIEDLTLADRRPWSPEQFATCARHLGEFNGRFLADRDPPLDEWLSRGWVRGWTDQAGPMIAQLPSLTDNPAVAELYPRSAIEMLLRVWEHRHDLYNALDTLQQSLAHNDIYPRNAFIDARDLQHTVAIDWALCGWAPLGADVAPMLGASLSFFEADCDQASELERLCLDAYLDGLRQAGSTVSTEDVYAGYLTTIVLRFMIGTTGQTLALALDHSLDAAAERMFGQPRSVLFERFRELNGFAESRMQALLHVFGYG